MPLDLPGPTGRLRTTWQVIKHPYTAYERWRATYGDTMRIPVLNGDVVASCDPAFVQDFLKLGDDEHRPFAVDAIAGVLGRGTMLVSAGERHRRQRRVVGPFFHGERMRAYAGLVGDIARARVAGWSGELRMLDEMLPISLEVIIRAVFGADTDEAAARYRAEIGEVVRRMAPMFFFSAATQRRLFGLGPWARYADARDRLHAHLVADLERCRAEQAAGGAERADILACLADARDEDGAPMALDDAAGELAGLLFAGHETTQIALAWAIYWLHRTPETLARLREELDAAPDDPEARVKLPYLDAVVHEALRLYPIVPDVLRTLAVDKVLGGVALPAGTHVAVAAAMTHMRDDIYPEPRRFRPERFIEQRPRPWTFLPFGGGVRRCIGAGLAMFEMKLVLAEVIGGVELELLGDEQPVRRNVTLAPANGVRVRVIGRRGA